MLKKKEYYRLDNVLENNAKYNLIFGGRNIGKTYAVKERFINRFFENPDANQFAYIRRWEQDLKRKFLDCYFDDKGMTKIIEKASNGKYNCIKSKEQKFYFANTLKAGGFELSKLQCGQAFAISSQEHYKSLNFSSISEGIFEEWITSRIYLPNEPEELNNLISTIERDNDFKLFMLANTISRVNPYISEWGLSNILRQKQGTIDTYIRETGKFNDNGEEIKDIIVCQYCSENDGANGVKKTSGNMIARGEWYSKQYPHLPCDKRFLENVYTVFMEYDSFRFKLELLKSNNNIFWYCERKTTRIKDGERVVSNKYVDSPLWTFNFTPLSQNERRAFKLLDDKKIVFCDDLTAQEFYQCLKNMNI